MVHMARPVPPDGEGRILIDKTYEDARSYITGGDSLRFDRPLGIKKNAVVLPPGYELVGVNYPSQVRTEADGRIAVSFVNIGPSEVPYVVRARRMARVTGGSSARGGPPAGEGSRESSTPPNRNPADAPLASPTAPAPVTPAPARAASSQRPIADDPRLGERAHQDREIVYSLQQPETHAFDLYHDYTESRPGVDKYVNVVRAGSRVSNPGARILDTGERLTTRTLHGKEIESAGIDIGEAVTDATEIVVIPFPAVRQGQSLRLRISETYSDAARYRLEGDDLVWDRSFGRPANAVVLPAGWALTNSSIPAVVSLMPDGRIRLDLGNPRNDDISVLITATRRPK